MDKQVCVLSRVTSSSEIKKLVRESRVLKLVAICLILASPVVFVHRVNDYHAFTFFDPLSFNVPQLAGQLAVSSREDTERSTSQLRGDRNGDAVKYDIPASEHVFSRYRTVIREDGVHLEVCRVAMGESLQPCSNIGPSSRFVGLSSSLGTLDRSFGLIEGIVGKLVRTSGLCSRVSGQTVGGIDLQLHLIHRLMKCLIAGVQGLSSEAISPSNLRPLKSRKDGVNAQDDQADYFKSKVWCFPSSCWAHPRMGRLRLGCMATEEGKRLAELHLRRYHDRREVHDGLCLRLYVYHHHLLTAWSTP